MSRFRSAYRGYDREFRQALRVGDIRTWLALWEPYGPCPHCHQGQGQPCLNLRTRGGALHLAEPHDTRPTSTPEAR